MSNPTILTLMFSLVLFAASVALVSHAVFVFRLKQARPDLWAAYRQARRSMQRNYAEWLLAAAGTDHVPDIRTRRWWRARVWSLRLLALFLSLAALGLAWQTLRPASR